MHAAVGKRDGGAPTSTSGTKERALTFVAAAVQHGRIGLHPRYFNHNALYHLIQAFALLLIFLAARGLLKPAAR